MSYDLNKLFWVINAVNFKYKKNILFSLLIKNLRYLKKILWKCSINILKEDTKNYDLYLF